MVSFYFRIFHMKKLLMKTISVKTENFSFDDLWSQNY